LRIYERLERILKKFLLTICFITLVLAGGAHAGQFDRRGFALGFKGEGLVPFDSDVLDAYKAFGGFGLDGKYYLEPISGVPISIAAEIDFLFGSGKIEESEFAAEDKADVKTTAEYSIFILPVTVGAYYEFLSKRMFNPYIGVGMGLDYINYTYSNSAFAGEANKSDNDFCFWIGGGGDVKFNRQWGLKFDLRYMYLGATKNAGGNNVGGLNFTLGGLYNF